MRLEHVAPLTQPGALTGGKNEEFKKLRCKNRRRSLKLWTHTRLY